MVKETEIMSVKWILKDRGIYLDWILKMRGDMKVWNSLSDWEKMFTESLYYRLFILQANLSENQANKLEGIYASKSR